MKIDNDLYKFYQNFKENHIIIEPNLRETMLYYQNLLENPQNQIFLKSFFSLTLEETS